MSSLGNILITGGASGLGAAVTEAVAAEGGTPYVIDRVRPKAGGEFVEADLAATETAGVVGVTLLIPGGMDTAFFDGRAEQYKPPPGAKLNRPEDTARAVIFALSQPPGCEVRELVVCSSEEGSWP